MGSISGKKIGVLLVVGESVAAGKYRVDVICEVCGHKKSIDKYTFLACEGRCGICAAGSPSDRELIGKEFSSFTVTGWPIREGSKYRYPVSCNNCGHHYSISKYLIHTAEGICTQCGNGRKLPDRTGEVFGDFVVVGQSFYENGKYLVPLQCVRCNSTRKLSMYYLNEFKGKCAECNAEQNPEFRYRSIKGRFRANNPKQICSECGITNWNGKPIVMDVDHIIARCNGGEDAVENLCYRCPNCHRQKTREDRRKARRKKAP